MKNIFQIEIIQPNIKNNTHIICNTHTIIPPSAFLIFFCQRYNSKELERLNITYSAKILGWNSLKKVTHLTIGGVKTQDLSFLEDMDNLEYLRIIKGTFSTIKGVDRCNKLKTIFIQGCNSLLEVKDTLINNKNIENLLLERCKNVILEGIESLGLKNLSVI